MQLNDKLLNLKDQAQKSTVNPPEQINYERILAKIALRIRQSLNLDEVLNTSVAEVRQFLQTDRVVIYRFEPDWNGIVVVESVSPDWLPTLGVLIPDTCFTTETHILPYKQGRIRAIEDIYTEDIAQCHVELLARFQVRSNLVVPILQGENLWGLLIAHHCSAPRRWQPWEIDLLEQLATHMAIAIQQSELYLQTQTELINRQQAEAALQKAKNELEIKVAERTRELQTTNQLLRDEIVERQQVEAALQKSQRRLNTLIDSLPGIVFSSANDPEWSMTYLSEGCLTLTGYTSEELTGIGKGVYNCIVDECDLQKRINTIETAIALKQPYVIEYRIRTQSGQEKWLWEKGSGVVDSNGEVSLEGFISDITKRRQAEEEIRSALKKEKELGEFKSRFVTITSHEFRTPLATILSSADILQRYHHKLTEEKKLHHLRCIQVTVKNMTQLLDDVLLIGKAEAGKLECKPTPFELVQFCLNLVEEMQITTNTHTISFHQQGECLTVGMDEKLLRHILSNLLSNAIKYSPSGGIVNFDLVCKQEKAIFRVQDRGIGIPTTDQANLFDSFHRATNVGTISGTGLGLAIVKKSVDLHGGYIAVNSEVEVGTTFIVTIPLHNQRATNEKDSCN